MRRASLLGVVGATLLVWATVAGCESRVSLGTSCRDSTQCGDALCGVGGRCRAECTTSADCASGARCLSDPATGVRGCSLALDEGCTAGSCGEGLRCVDGECLGVCIQSLDCPDGLCVDEVCVVPSADLDASILDAASDAGAMLDAPASSCPAAGTLAVDVGRWSVCAIRCDHSVLCWGYWGDALLGDVAPDCDGTPCFSAPHAIALPELAFREIAVGDTRACALSEGGQVWCWGLLPDVPLTNATLIRNDDGTELQATELVAGGGHVCVRDAMTRAFRCFGTSPHGELGAGETTSRTSPVVPFEGIGADRLVPGEGRTQIVAPGGGTWGVGSNAYGEIVPPPSADLLSPTPGPVTRAPPIDLVVSASTTCALDSDGDLECWGRMATLFGAVEPSLLEPCGDGFQCLTRPVLLARGALPRPLERVVGDRFAPILLAWTPDGVVHGVGQSSEQVLGSLEQHPSFEALPALAGARTHLVRVGAETACAILDDTRELVCWGQNHVGQLGRGMHGAASAVAEAPRWP